MAKLMHHPNYNILIIANPTMHSKIYKAKLLAAHSHQESNSPTSIQKATAIHAHFGMITHVFQRNRNMVKFLKLSGTKIQQPSRQIIRGSTVRRKRSELVGTHNQHDKYDQGRVQQLARQQSLPTYAFVLNNNRNTSVKSRYQNHPTQKLVSNASNGSSVQFIPIGQAYRKTSLTKTTLGTRQPQQCKTVITLDMNNDDCLKQAAILRQMVQASRKHKNRPVRRIVKAKSEANEALTNNSSIRTTNKSYKQPYSVIKLAISPQEVTPW